MIYVIHTLYSALINATNKPIVGVLDTVIYGVIVSVMDSLFGSVIAAVIVNCF